ncbi:Protein disulfide isomerase [Seminavis robusta]|uniref:Protein disulfide isomerase n=1 Tax=Seminavis robusta TaxID=568900 RepID=A0A9N8EMA0_9STRA|nr:Protein disulfide isomerase [Seminavis robusta]|eukprot:Sro1401_g269410.1 Protein disulfide isomerase (470) ;mRNA; f:4889-6418
MTNYRSLFYCWLSVALVVLLAPNPAIAAAADTAEYVEGQPLKTLVKLNEATFRKASNDPANPIFLYMFSAYWCGHCKRLAPVLESVAPQVTGRLAIGKIDCTEDKKLCDEFKVRGYPTLKFSMDGEMYEYNSGRKESDFVAFADRLSRPVVTMLNSVEQAHKYTKDQTYGHGVSFLCHDPAASKALADAAESTVTIDKLAAKSPILHVCKLVARKEMADAHFAALATSVDTSSITGLPAPSEPTTDNEGGEQDSDVATEQGFVCRLEDGVPSRCMLEKQTTIDIDSLWEFVKVNNVASLTELGPQNLHRIGRLGRPLVVGVADVGNEAQLNQLKQNLESFAINGPPRLTSEKYYFGWMDGVRWSKFLQQFDISQDDLPQIFVMDVPNRLYWQDPAYKEQTLEAFLTAIEDGIIVSKESGGVRGARFLLQIANGFYDWLPWSLLLIVAIAAGAIMMIIPASQELADKKND